MKRFRITVEGTAYEVTVEELDQPVEPVRTPYPVNSAAPAVGEHHHVARPERTEAHPAKLGDVISPLAGVVVSVSVTVGQAVTVGDPLLILEAMKMQTTISAPHAGTVAAISVSAGASVQEGQPLMSLS